MEIVLIIFLFLAPFIVYFVVKSKYEKAVALIYNVIDDDTEQEIYNLVDSTEARISELEKNEIAEYNRLKNEINTEANNKISGISRSAAAERNRIGNEANAIKHQGMTSGNYNAVHNAANQQSAEVNAVNSQARVATDSIKNEQKAALNNLKQQYSEELAEYAKLKTIRKDGKLLKKIFEKAKKNESLGA